MISGRVTTEREAVVSVEVRGVGGSTRDFGAVVDTGFNGFLSLPPVLIAELGLARSGSAEIMLGDGSVVSLPMYRASAIWDGVDHRIDVVAAEGGAVVGMALLEGFHLHIDCRAEGLVTIERSLD